MSARGIPLPPTPPTQDSVQPGVYLLPRVELNKYAPPWFIDGRPIRALAPHPERPDLVYVTNEHPALLSFLDEPYVELG
jgi:hypothetical protein